MSVENLHIFARACGVKLGRLYDDFFVRFENLDGLLCGNGAKVAWNISVWLIERAFDIF